MSSESLGAILANAESRVAELKPDPPASEQEGRQRLRAIASLLGHDADAVLGRYDDGGALADFVRSLLNIEPRQPGRSGAPRSDRATATFLEYLVLAGDGLSKNEAVRRLARKMGVKEETVKQRIKRGLDRTRGPGGIAELYTMMLKERVGGT